MRILIAGNEIGGQMQLLAESLRKRWLQASAASYNSDFRGYQNDIMLAQNGWVGQLDRGLFFLWAVRHFQVFHFFWGVSLLSIWRFRLLDLPILKMLGKKVIVHFRGLDIIDINHFDYLRARSRGEQVDKPPLSRPDQLRLVRKWLKYADVVLVSEPDLFEVVPSAVLSPQIVDCNYWSTTKLPLSESDGIIRIAHAPSSRRKKGTEFIEIAISRLKERGYPVELVLVENVGHHKVKELYELSDIGIDQVLYGWHGKVSVEIMALGRPVICNIDPELRKYRPTLPIVHASPENLEDVIQSLVIDAERRRELGRRSIEYATQFHNVDNVVDELLDLYGIVEKNQVKDKIQDPKTW